MEYKVEQGGDTTILIRSFLIKDINAWQKTSGQDFFEDYFNQRSSGAHQKWKVRQSRQLSVQFEEVKTKTYITYHRLYQFGKLFELNNLTLAILEKTLSPDENREAVF